MTFQAQTLVYAYYMGNNEKCLIGRLFLKNRTIFFEYDVAFIKKGLELSPFKLPLKPGVMTANEHIFEGLFGIFNDSLPDGWGRLLLDRKLITMGLNPGMLSPLDRLCFVGNEGMGAIGYEPENPSGTALVHESLDEIAEEINKFQENKDDFFIDDLLTLGGFSVGARPKIVIKQENEDWLIKFRSSMDPSDIGNIEYAYHLMAVAAGLDVPKGKLFPSRKIGGYFGVKRFDRKNGRRVHMHTLSGLLHTDHQQLCVDYETIMKATLFLTRDVRECEKQFRAAVFNILSHNRDDHAKNFSYLMDEDSLWTVSPAYDLTFSSGPSGEHSTMVMGEAKRPTLEHCLKLAAVGDIAKQRAIEIIDEVKASVSMWEQFASEAGVSKASRKMIKTALEKIYVHLSA